MSATFSACGKYRHILVREGSEYCGWIMLNPSVANDTEDDPTMRKVRGFSKDIGYSGVVVGNLYDLISTDPTELWNSKIPPSSPSNDAFLSAICALPFVVVAWGANAKDDRARAVLDLLKRQGVTPYCLGTNMNGSPKHPLYVPYSTTFKAYSL